MDRLVFVQLGELAGQDGLNERGFAWMNEFAIPGIQQVVKDKQFILLAAPFSGITREAVGVIFSVFKNANVGNGDSITLENVASNDIVVCVIREDKIPHQLCQLLRATLKSVYLPAGTHFVGDAYVFDYRNALPRQFRLPMSEALMKS